MDRCGNWLAIFFSINRNRTFGRIDAFGPPDPEDPAKDVELTGAGRDNLLTRIEDNADRNVERWKKLPYLANFQEPGTPKPGAVVLAEMLPGNGRIRLPLLVTARW